MVSGSNRRLPGRRPEAAYGCLCFPQARSRMFATDFAYHCPQPAVARRASPAVLSARVRCRGRSIRRPGCEDRTLFEGGYRLVSQDVAWTVVNRAAMQYRIQVDMLSAWSIIG
jgi:hypothetical protein